MLLLKARFARIHVKWDILKWFLGIVKTQIRKHFSTVLDVLKHAYLHTVLHPFLKNAERLHHLPCKRSITDYSSTTYVSSF